MLTILVEVVNWSYSKIYSNFASNEAFLETTICTNQWTDKQIIVTNKLKFSQLYGKILKKKLYFKIKFEPINLVAPEREVR